MRRTNGTQLRRKSLSAWLLIVIIVVELAVIGYQDAANRCHYDGAAVPCSSKIP